uniref:Protein kinase domain-containing protein n=1 Tax=Saccharum hybrid cultivar R570 TaxID=131158 RepID=A0A059Q2Q4_9POAL|nr:hypothetical protein SHCRBa_027_K06_R_350 [Saccharum hybrid cultivar R570]
MRVRHPNIIRLVGYCYETRRKYVMIPNGDYVWARMEERALCFEYLQRGSLDNFLSDESCGLHWHTCYQIIKGICEGLNYLHNGYGDPIYHLDLKPENILLDGNMMPIISDFGLSRLFGSTKTHMTQSNIKGTFGYMPPEYIDKRLISKKFDVFSLGIIIIRIMAGKLAYPKCVEMPGQQFIDLEVADSIEEVKTCIQIALRCVEADREKRPTIRSIMDKLNDIETMRKSRINQGFILSYICKIVAHCALVTIDFKVNWWSISREILPLPMHEVSAPKHARDDTASPISISLAVSSIVGARKYTYPETSITVFTNFLRLNIVLLCTIQSESSKESGETPYASMQNATHFKEAGALAASIDPINAGGRLNQTSSVSNLPGLMIDPLELRFYFEINREISCILQLRNNSDDFVAFGTTVDQSKYSTRPDKGVMTPWSKRYMIVTMQAQEHAPPDMESNDIFLLQSTIVGEEFTPSDITEHLFKNMVAASKVVANEMKLPIVYVV